MTDPILVPFEGDTSGEAELTWGQQHIWEWMASSGLPLNMTATRTLDDGATIDEFVDELRFFMNRFEAMRTRFRFDEHGWPSQIVHRSGEVPLHVLDTPAGTDPAEIAAGVAAEHQQAPFDHTREWPVRMTLVRQDGRLTHLVTTLGHALFDSVAAMVMFTDLLGRDPATGAAKEPISDLSPLELAAWQASPAGLRQSAAALRYWEQHLRAIPVRRSRHPVAEAPPTGERYWRYVCESPAISLGLRCLARRLGTETTSILLTAYAVALAEVAGHEPVVLQVLVNNRFRNRLAMSVSPVNQAGLLVLDLAGMRRWPVPASAPIPLTSTPTTTSSTATGSSPASGTNAAPTSRSPCSSTTAAGSPPWTPSRRRRPRTSCARPCRGARSAVSGWSRSTSCSCSPSATPPTRCC